MTQTNKTLPQQKPQRAGAQRTIARRRPAAGDSLKLHKNQLFFPGSVVIFTAFLGLFAVNLLHPFSFTDNSYADSDSSSFDTSTNVTPNLSISASSVSMNGAPEVEGSWLTGTSTVDVSTNNATGYTLYVSSSTDELNLVNTNNSNYTIDNLDAETTLTTFQSSADLMNHYGFTHDNNGDDSDNGQIITGTYLPLTTISNPRKVKVTSEKANTSTTNVTFSTKVDQSIPAGEYTNTITFTAVANEVMTKTYMQDVDYATWCNTSAVETFDPTSEDTIKATTYELWDKRTNFDNEYPYYIRKLSDGNCWMVENLYLEGGKTLTSNDSNVSTDYPLPASSTEGFSDNGAANLYSGGRNRDDYTTTNNGTTYPADGSYMTWGLAKTGTASGKNSDVCPKNWRLPTGSADGSAASASEQAYLVSLSYSVFDKFFFADANGGNNSAIPIYSGGYDGGTLGDNGSNVSWWSNTQHNTNYGYRLYRSSTNILSTGYYGVKRFGFSVRCLLAGS